MRKIYYILLFVTGLSYSQDDLISEWHLESFTIEGATYNNVYSYLCNINFTEDISFQNYFSFSGSSTCNGIGGEYSYSDDELVFHNIGQTLADCFPYPHGDFENLYIYLLSNNFIYQSTFNYTIEGLGDEQKLILINSNNDTIIYGKTENNNQLFRIWYLESIIQNETTYNITPSSSPNIDFTYNILNPFAGFGIEGNGGCNDFIAAYEIYFNNGDEISVFNFNPTMNSCDPPSAFEDVFFDILSNDDTNQFSFEIINNGDNLILTSIPTVGGRSVNPNEIILTFKNQPLSVEDFTKNELKISIAENPIFNNQLKLSFDSSLLTEIINFYIYNLEGKLVKSSVLNGTIIDVKHMASGMYFIRFENDSNFVSSLKFIKK